MIEFEERDRVCTVENAYIEGTPSTLVKKVSADGSRIMVSGKFGWKPSSEFHLVERLRRI